MIKNILFALTVFIAQFSFADAWDNLTYAEAEAVVAELKENPFIFDYCDCCPVGEEAGVMIQLIKVTNTEIIECSWDTEYYSVIIDFISIATVRNGQNGADSESLSEPALLEVEKLTIYMNYTWGFNPITKMASPYFDIIPYSTYGDAHACQVFFEFPTPKQIKKVSRERSYKKWYNSHVK